MAESGERSVLTLIFLCLSCCVRGRISFMLIQHEVDLILIFNDYIYLMIKYTFEVINLIQNIYYYSKNTQSISLQALRFKLKDDTSLERHSVGFEKVQLCFN